MDITDWNPKAAQFDSFLKMVKAMNLLSKMMCMQAGANEAMQAGESDFLKSWDQARKTLKMYFIQLGEPRGTDRITAEKVVASFEALSQSWQAMPEEKRNANRTYFSVEALPETVSELLQDEQAVLDARNELNLNVSQFIEEHF